MDFNFMFYANCPTGVYAITLLIVLCSMGESSNEDLPLRYALSPVYLQYLELSEARLYTLLKDSNLLQFKPQDKLILLNYIEEYEKNVENHIAITGQETSSLNYLSNDHESDRVGVVSSNPILAIQMLGRLFGYFGIGTAAHQFVSQKVIVQDLLPTEDDILDAVEALFRLQYVYGLDAQEVASGILQGTKTNAQFTTKECYELAKIAQTNQYFTLALQWFEITLKKLKSNDFEGDPSLISGFEETIVNDIRDTISEHNRFLTLSLIEDGKIEDMYSFITPVYSISYSAIAHLTQRKRNVEQLTGSIILDRSNSNYFRSPYIKMMVLCSGKSLQPEKLKAKLKCYLDTHRHPYWRINPLKVEVLNENPRIIQMYNIFNDGWISYLKNLSYSDLERAPPQVSTEAERTASYVFFEETDLQKIPVSKIVEFVTGLNVVEDDASDMLQVAASGFGGHVSPHYDSFSLGSNQGCVGGDDPGEDARKGYRLNKVELGGRTVFPHLGVTIKPVKNSAILWYNNLKNGLKDDRMIHAACPVISGEKWIATKWTRINKNVLKRPCGLRPGE